MRSKLLLDVVCHLAPFQIDGASTDLLASASGDRNLFVAQLDNPFIYHYKQVLIEDFLEKGTYFHLLTRSR